MPKKYRVDDSDFKVVLSNELKSKIQNFKSEVGIVKEKFLILVRSAIEEQEVKNNRLFSSYKTVHKKKMLKNVLGEVKKELKVGEPGAVLSVNNFRTWSREVTLCMCFYVDSISLLNGHNEMFLSKMVERARQMNEAEMPMTEKVKWQIKFHESLNEGDEGFINESSKGRKPSSPKGDTGADSPYVMPALGEHDEEKYLMLAIRGFVVTCDKQKIIDFLVNSKNPLYKKYFSIYKEVERLSQELQKMMDRKEKEEKFRKENDRKAV